MEKKKLRKIEAGAAIFVIVAVTFILGTGPSIIADPYQQEPFHDMVRVSLTATDSQSSVEYINYSISCTNPLYQYLGWQQFDASQSQTDPVSFWFELNKLGDYTVQYYAVDSFGNVEALKETTFSIEPSDQTPPTTTIFITDAIPT